MEKKIFHNKFLNILGIFLLILFILTNFSSAFTDEENTEIDRIVTTMIKNSADNGVTWALDNSSNSKLSFFNCNLTYNNDHCSYICVRTWNGEMKLVLDENTLTSTCIWGGTHEVHIFYYNNDLELLGIDTHSLEYNQSISLDNVNYYFKSDVSIYDVSGNKLDPFFQITPVPVLEGIMKQEQAEKRTIQEILGVLPLIIVVVVSFLGLRKALRILVNSLKRS